LPVLAMAGIGAVVHRLRAFDVQTLVRLSLYLFTPVFLFTRIADSTMSWGQIGGVGVAIMLPLLVLGLVIYLSGRAVKAEGNTIAAMLVGGLFFNAANFGIPVAELAFDKSGGQVQALVVMFMNTTMFFAGYVVMAVAQGRGIMTGVKGYLKLPMIYMIIAGFAVRDGGISLPVWLNKALHTLADGMVPMALVTLGAQLATRGRWPRWKLIVPVTLLKLLILPAVTGVLVYAMGLWPWPGAQLILAAAAPTAINTLLLTLELKGDADTAADCVFWTTLVSSVSVTVVLAVVQVLGGGPR
jgi:hypothetical protein